MWEYYNPNPVGARVGDCVIRAISKATNRTWEDTYINLCLYGLLEGDLPSANHVWGRFLKENGFEKHLADGCTVSEFAKEHKDGTYILVLSGHAVAVINGNYYDTWDSAMENVIFFWEKGE